MSLLVKERTDERLLWNVLCFLAGLVVFISLFFVPFPLSLLGALYFTLFGVALLIQRMKRRFLPDAGPLPAGSPTPGPIEKRSARPETNLGAMWERYAPLPCIATSIILCATLPWWWKLAEYIYLNAIYGHEAWATGLRVVDKHGLLSNGGQLSGAGNTLLGFGCFLLSVPFFIASIFGLTYLRMRRRGERLSDQLAKYEQEHADAF